MRERRDNSSSKAFWALLAPSKAPFSAGMIKFPHFLLAGTLGLLSATTCACSSESPPDYGTRSIAIVDSTANLEAPDESFCRLEAEPIVLATALRVADGGAIVEISNTEKTHYEGQVELRAMTSRAEQFVLVPFEIAGNDKTTLTVPLSRLGIDGAVELSLITGNVQATAKDDSNSSTFASASTLYDVRTTKPEEEDSGPDDARFEAVTVAIVRDGVDEERLRSKKDGDDLDDESIEKVLVSNKTLCFDVQMSLASGSVGDDVWPNQSTIAWARGQRIEAKPPGGTWSTWWLDSVGCKTANMDSGVWTFRAVTSTRILKNGLWTIIKNLDDDIDQMVYTEFTATLNTAASQTVQYAIGVSSNITASHVIHWSLFMAEPDLTIASFPSTLTVKVDYSGTVSTANKDGIYIVTASKNDKWLIAHEVGHYVFFNETGQTNSTFYQFDLTLSGPKCASGGGHTASSREWNSAANLEGFGDFWAGLNFNNTLQNDCWARLATSNVSCAGPDAAHPLRFMETQCGDGVNSFTGHGNETDWMRTYWYMVRGDLPSVIPSVHEVLVMVDNASGWTKSNHFVQLQAASNLPATPSYLEDRWDDGVDANGIYF